MAEDRVIAFACGAPRNHECDSEGPCVYFLRDGGTTTDRSEAEEKGCTGGSVTCSQCGLDAATLSLWRDH